MQNLLIILATLTTALPAPAHVDPRIRQAMQTVQAAQYPNANVLWILNDQSVVYQSDGQFVLTAHTAKLVLTRTGRAQVASESLDYAKDGEQVQVLRAQVVKKDGTVVPVAPDDIQDVELSGAANIYDPNGRAVKVTFRGVTVGDVVDLQYKLIRRQPTRFGFFDDEFWLQSSEPMLEASYTADGPKSLRLVSTVYHPERAHGLVERTEVTGSRVHYAWQVSDVPQVIPEGAMDWTSEMPILVVTTDPSWQDFSRWWAGVAKPKLDATAEIRAKVAELTRGAKTDDERIKALYDFVAQNIRYRGLGVGPRTGYTPRSADETFRSRWGVCRDVAILLTSMLHTAGFKAYPVLTNAGDPVLPKIAYDGFNHAIVAMPTKEGGWRYLDPTAKNDASLLPGFEREQDTLVATAKGEPLTRIPPLPSSLNLGRAIVTTVLAEDGSLRSQIHLESNGVVDYILRSNAVWRSLDQQQELAERTVHAAFPEGKLIEFRTSDPHDLATPMSVDFSIAVPNAAPKMGRVRLLRTAVTSGMLGAVERWLPGWLGALPKREYGLDSRMTLAWDESEQITLPGRTRILELPESAKLGSRVSHLLAGCTRLNANQLTCTRSFAIESRFINPNEYLSLRGGLATLSQIDRQPIIVAAEGK